MVTLPYPLRLFRRWLHETQDSFAAPVVIRRITRKHIDFSFQGITPSVVGCLTHRGQLVIAAELNGECWDLLNDFDVSESIDQDRHFFCALCEPASRTSYVLRRDLWIEHSFIPFRAWVNEILIKERYVEFYRRSDRGSTWAKLSDGQRDQDKDYLFARVELQSWFTAQF